MMRIYFAAPYEREWDMGRFCVKALKNLGHNIKVFNYRKQAKLIGMSTLSQFPCFHQWGIDKANTKMKKEVTEYNPDALLTLKGELILPETIEWVRDKLGVPTILWCPDDPQLFNTVSRRIAPAYDYVFTNSTDAIYWYRDIGVKRVKWIGFGCDPGLHRRVILTKEEKMKYGGDICFVGTFFPERLEILRVLKDFDLKIWGPGWNNIFKKEEELLKLYGNEGVFLEEMVKIYNARKIVLNIQHVQQKYGRLTVNMKIFEVTGCGAFLLTARQKGIEDLFEIGKEIVCYESKEELMELVKYFLNNQEEREKIAINGQKRAYKDHTYEKRMKEILSVL